MVVSSVFLLVLAASVVAYWLLPQRLRMASHSKPRPRWWRLVYCLRPQRPRMAFLSLVSAGYVITYIFQNNTEHRFSGFWLLGLCVLFYQLAPLAKRQSKAGIRWANTAPQSPEPQAAPEVATPPAGAIIVPGIPSKPQTVIPSVPARDLASKSKVRFFTSTLRMATVVAEKIRSLSGFLVAPPAAADRPTTAAFRTYRWTLPLLLLVALGYLAVFKYFFPRYAPAGGGRPALIPLGISYFTFKFIHYVIEVARGSIKDRSPWQFLGYIFLFPTFSSGPIERFDHFLANQDTQLRLQTVVEGLTRIMHGLIKKLVIVEIVLARAYAMAADPNLLHPRMPPGSLHLWGLAITSYFYLYMDFSGYCDIAIGAARLFGIRIMENFDWPILAANIGVFWKRWHMTLAGWCQSYIYMPVLGLTRNTTVALYATFIAIGLWHEGALPWLAWGLYNATGILVFQYWVRFKRRMKWNALDRGIFRYVGIPITFLFVSAGEVLVFAAARTPHDMLRLMARLAFIQIRA
ncbi:MAG: MBOAT family O-acyltransferase [Tepidisphaeraceae bacterium]|jgi:alginate O-acetyltransferase complex protein AlgI